MKAPSRGLCWPCLVAALCLLAPVGPAAYPAGAQDCADLIADGGFETGGAWQLGVTPVPPEYVTYAAHAGARSLALGITQGANTKSYSSARQPVWLPANATQAKLTFWVYAVVGSEPVADKLQALLLKPNGDTLAILWTSNANNPTWTQLTYDLTPWVGEAVQVYFNVINDGVGGTAGMFLDDVSLVACPGAATAATPEAVPYGAGDDALEPPAVTPWLAPEAPTDTFEPEVVMPEAAYLTPEAGVDSAYVGSLEPATDLVAVAQGTFEPASEAIPTEQGTFESAPDSGTPALVFFTPTAELTPSPTGSAVRQAVTGTQEVVSSGSATPELTRISLVVTPAWTFTPRPTRNASSPPGGTPAPPQPGGAPFAQWPKGWWFAAGAVLVIILAAGLVARRSG
jgi:hypothetical protein